MIITTDYFLFTTTFILIYPTVTSFDKKLRNRHSHIARRHPLVIHASGVQDTDIRRRARKTCSETLLNRHRGHFPRFLVLFAVVYSRRRATGTARRSPSASPPADTRSRAQWSTSSTARATPRSYSLPSSSHRHHPARSDDELRPAPTARARAQPPTSHSSRAKARTHPPTTARARADDRGIVAPPLDSTLARFFPTSTSSPTTRDCQLTTSCRATSREFQVVERASFFSSTGRRRRRLARHRRRARA